MENTQKNKEHNLKRSGRSVSYPSIALDSAVDFMEKFSTALGRVSCSREDAAKAIGYSGISGSSARTIAALGQYGLLDRVGNNYSMSELAEEIIHSTDESGISRKRALAKAAILPKLFQKIFAKLENQPLPSLLENIILRDGVSVGSAKEVASIFKETLQFSGLLVNGVVKNNFVDSELNCVSEKDDVSLDGVDRSLLKKQESQKGFVLTDSGAGWYLSINSDKPLTSEVRKLLVDISDLLGEINS